MVYNTQSLYSLSFWNPFNNELGRTNNAFEGCHYKLNKNFGKIHPSIYELLSLIYNMQELFEIDTSLLARGTEPEKGKKKYRDAHEKVLRVK